MTLFLPLSPDGSPLAGGRVTVEQRSGDWMAFVTGDRGRWECAATPLAAVELLRASHPDAFTAQAVSRRADQVKAMIARIRSSPWVLSALASGVGERQRLACAELLDAAGEARIRGEMSPEMTDGFDLANRVSVRATKRKPS